MLLVLVNDLERSERQEKIIMDPITDQQAKNPKAVEPEQCDVMISFNVGLLNCRSRGWEICIASYIRLWPSSCILHQGVLLVLKRGTLEIGITLLNRVLYIAVTTSHSWYSGGRNRRRGAVFRKSRRRQSNVASARANAPEHISGIPRPSTNHSLLVCIHQSA